MVKSCTDGDFFRTTGSEKSNRGISTNLGTKLYTCDTEQKYMWNPTFLPASYFDHHASVALPLHQ